MNIRLLLPPSAGPLAKLYWTFKLDHLNMPVFRNDTKHLAECFGLSAYAVVLASGKAKLEIDCECACGDHVAVSKIVGSKEQMKSAIRVARGLTYDLPRCWHCKREKREG